MAETPPRMRGRLTAENLKNIVDGNTPAYAGKTSPFFIRWLYGKKHPRVCGEDNANPLKTG